MSSTMTDAVSRTTSEQIERANATDRTPVVFIHGLWLLPSSWNRWAALFEEAGYPAVTPGWPDDPETVEEAKAHPETFAHKMVGQLAALPGGHRQPESLDRGEGRHGERRARAAPDHRRREGQHRPVGDRGRLVQEAKAEQGRDRDHQGTQPRALARDRQRLAGGRRDGARLCQALRLV